MLVFNDATQLRLFSLYLVSFAAGRGTSEWTMDQRESSVVSSVVSEGKRWRYGTKLTYDGTTDTSLHAAQRSLGPCKPDVPNHDHSDKPLPVCAPRPTLGRKCSLITG
jgi:hypothetical protein